MKQLYWLADQEGEPGDTENVLQEGGEAPGMDAQTSEQVVQDTTQTPPAPTTPQDTEPPQESTPAPAATAPIAAAPVNWQKYAPAIAGVAVIGALIFFFMRKK